MIKQHALNPINFFSFTLILFLLNACGTFEIGIEQPPKPTQATVMISSDEVVPSKTPSPTVSSPTATSQAPLPAALQVMFIADGNVWLWREGAAARSLTALDRVEDVR